LPLYLLAYFKYLSTVCANLLKYLTLVKNASDGQVDHAVGCIYLGLPDENSFYPIQID
jgi:hypothetical protein